MLSDGVVAIEPGTPMEAKLRSKYPAKAPPPITPTTVPEAQLKSVVVEQHRLAWVISGLDKMSAPDRWGYYNEIYQ